MPSEDCEESQVCFRRYVLCITGVFFSECRPGLGEMKKSAAGRLQAVELWVGNLLRWKE